jgi:pimeloyl-ACP methyl ester carboxylesterase
MFHASDSARDGYAPYPLTTDAAALGLVETTVRGPIGTAVARHRPERTTTTATILLHGAAGSWTTWTPMLAAADDAGLDIPDPVLLDLPGWGDATPAPGSPALTIEIVSDLVRQVAVELGYDSWHLVGHSLGGFIALHIAAVWPDSTRSVGLVSGTTYSVIGAVSHPRAGMRDIPGFVMLLGFFRLVAPVQGAFLAVVGVARRIGIIRLASKPLFRHLFRIDATVIAALARELRPHSFVTAAEVARGYDADGSWARIECPVRATKGDRDVFVSQRDLDRLEERIGDCVTTVVADCGHFGNVEHPLAVLAALGLGEPRR